MEQSKQNTAIVQGSILAAASIISRIIGLFYKIPMTRIVGKEGMTYYSQAYEIYSIALLISSFSIPLAISKIISYYEAKKEYINAKRAFISAMIFAVLSGGVCSLVVYFGADYFAKIQSAPGIAQPLKVLAPTIFVFAIMGVLRGLFQGKKNMAPTAASQVLEQIVNAFVSIFASYELIKMHSLSKNVAAYGAVGGTLGTFFGAVSSLFFVMFIYYINRSAFNRKLKKDISGNIAPYGELLKIIIITLVPVLLSQTVYQLSGIIDMTMYNRIQKSIGMDESVRDILYESYSNKYRSLTNVPVAIATAMGTAIVPTITRLVTQKKYKDVRKQAAISIKVNMIIAIPAAVGMAVLSKPIIVFLYADYAEVSHNVLQLGAISIVFFALSTVTNGILQGLGRLRAPVIHSAISLLLHIGLLYVLLKKFELNVYGLVIGNVVFALIVCILNAIAIKRTIRYRQELLRTFILPFIAAAIMGIAAYYSHHWLEILTKSNTIATLTAIAVAVFIYVFLIVILRVVNEDEIRRFPKGHLLVKILKKVKLLR